MIAAMLWRMSSVCFAVLSLLTSPLCAEIVISEIHYAPADKTEPDEFVELFNSGSVEVDLSGWSFSRGIDYTFPDGTRLAAKKYLVIRRARIPVPCCCC